METKLVTSPRKKESTDGKQTGQEPAPVKPTPQIIICDTNVVILLALFKKSVLFSARYPHGTIRVHTTVVDELNAWVERKGAKVRKFGEPLLNDIIETCAQYTSGINDLPDSQWVKQKAYLNSIEQKLAVEEKGLATSDTDKLLLATAIKNNARLATQERTLRSLAKRLMGDEYVISFEDLVIAMIEVGQITESDVETGFHALAHYHERLPADSISRIKKALEKNRS